MITPFYTTTRSALMLVTLLTLACATSQQRPTCNSDIEQDLQMCLETEVLPPEAKQERVESLKVEAEESAARANAKAAALHEAELKAMTLAVGQAESEVKEAKAAASLAKANQGDVQATAQAVERAQAKLDAAKGELEKLQDKKRGGEQIQDKQMPGEQTGGESAKNNANPEGQSSTMTVVLHGLDTSKGEVEVYLFSGPERFPTRHGADQTLRVKASNGAKVHFKGLKPGTYAISAFHDIDNNDKMAYSIIPPRADEPFALSNNIRPRFSMPDFEDAAFSFPTGKPVDIYFQEPRAAESK